MILADNNYLIPSKIKDSILNNDEEKLKIEINENYHNLIDIDWVKFAIDHNSFSCIQLFLDMKYIVNKRDKLGRNIFHYGCIVGNSNLIQLLIEHLKKEQIDISSIVNAQDINQQTPLMLAVLNNKIHTLMILLQSASQSILVNKFDKNGNTALHLAATQKLAPAISKLIAAGADTSLQNEELQTVFDIDIQTSKIIDDVLLEKNYPLHFAAKKGDLNKVGSAFAAKSEKINEIDTQGNSLLHYAAMSNNLPMIKFLVEIAKFPTNTRNYNSMTVLDIAHQQNCNLITSYLTNTSYKEYLYNHACEIIGHPITHTAFNAIVFSGVTHLFNTWMKSGSVQPVGAGNEASKNQLPKEPSLPAVVNIESSKQLAQHIGFNIGPQLVVSALNHRGNCNIF